MYARFLLALASVPWLVAAQDDTNEEFTTTVLGTLVVTRTGDRDPYLRNESTRALTSLGANQLFAVGSSFRRRYIASASENRNDAMDAAPIAGLSSNVLDNDQLFVQTPNDEYLGASALAFLQGLYPPFKPDNSSSGTLDPSSITDDIFMEGPMDGYQYVQLLTVSDMDPDIIFLSGQSNCRSRGASVSEYEQTSEYTEAQRSSSEMLRKVGAAFLNEYIEPKYHDYANAYLIYDYLKFQYDHNSTAKKILDKDFAGDLDRIRLLADQQQWAWNGNFTEDDKIRTIPGQTLATRIVELLNGTIRSRGQYNKVNLLFTEFAPFLSFFALSRLVERNPMFRGLPEYGSSMTFEIFSQSRGANTPADYPDPSEIWVRFSFRNGSTFGEDRANATLQAYPLFGRGPSQADMRWSEFVHEMDQLSGGLTIKSWCETCGAPSLFCYGFNASGPNGFDFSSGGDDDNDGPVSPVVAGVIGALVSLVVAGLILAAFMFLLGVRFHRHPEKSRAGRRSPRSSPAGGHARSWSGSTWRSSHSFANPFRRRGSGGQGARGMMQLGSDTDLALPAAAAVAGERGGVEKGGQHRRVESWELKETGGTAAERREHAEEDEGGLLAGERPVNPRESV